MRISTGLALLNALSVDSVVIGVARKSRQSHSSDLATILGAALTACAPLIAMMVSNILRKDEDTNTGDTEKTTPVPIGTTPKEPVSSESVSRVDSGAKLMNSNISPDIHKALLEASRKYNQDYSTLYSIAGVESTFRANAKADTTSAQGLFQFTSKTWKYLTDKYPALGYTLEDRNDVEKSSTMAAIYIKSIRASLSKSLGRDPSVSEIYVAYFLGPTGANKFFSALKSKPLALASDLFPGQAESNPNIFYEDGDLEKPLTMQQVFDKLSGKVEKFYVQTQTPTKPSEIVSTISVASSASPVPQIQVSLPEVKAKPVIQEITPADLPSPTRVSRSVEVDSPQPAAVSTPVAPPREITFIRDRQDRLFSVSG